MWWIKLLVFLLIAASVVALFGGLARMIRGHADKNAMVRALAWRVGLSLLAFLVLVLSKYMGWLEPHGVTNLKPAMQEIQQQVLPVSP